jgi:hypothetical protein
MTVYSFSYNYGWGFRIWKMEMENENGKCTMKSAQQPRSHCQRQSMSFFNMNLIFCTT